jgi:hypothetical protein
MANPKPKASRPSVKKILKHLGTRADTPHSKNTKPKNDPMSVIKRGAQKAAEGKFKSTPDSQGPRPDTSRFRNMESTQMLEVHKEMGRRKRMPHARKKK